MVLFRLLLSCPSSAAKRYGSKESGERVAGAILKNLRKEEFLGEVNDTKDGNNKKIDVK